MKISQEKKVETRKRIIRASVDIIIEKGLKIKKDFAPLWYNRSIVYIYKANKNEVILSLKRAIEIDPTAKTRAAKDKDFEKIRHDENFKRLIE